MDPKLVNATKGIAPPANILGSSMYNQISKLGAIDRSLPVSSGLASASIGQAEKQVEAQKAAAAAAKQKAVDLADPNKYRKIKKVDGGYDFYAPDGSKIELSELTRRTDTKPLDWIGDSENPIDKGFAQDYKALEDYTNNKFNTGSKQSQSYAKEVEKQIKEQYGVDIAQMTPDQLAKLFREAYPTVYGSTNTSRFSSRFGGNAGRGVPVGRTFVPSLSAGDIGYTLDNSDVGL